MATKPFNTTINGRNRSFEVVDVTGNASCSTVVDSDLKRIRVESDLLRLCWRTLVCFGVSGRFAVASKEYLTQFTAKVDLE